MSQSWYLTHGVKSVKRHYMKETIVTTKIERSSLQQLKVIAALAKERMTDVLTRLIADELKRVQEGDTNNAKKDI